MKLLGVSSFTFGRGLTSPDSVSTVSPSAVVYTGASGISPTSVYPVSSVSSTGGPYRTTLSGYLWYRRKARLVAVFFAISTGHVFHGESSLLVLDLVFAFKRSS